GVRPSGRGSGGLRGMRLPENGKIVSLLVAPTDSELQVLTATQNGYGKRTPIADYSRKGKGGQGIIAIDTGERNGELIGAALVNPTDDLMLITDWDRLHCSLGFPELPLNLPHNPFLRP
ncbi:MAG: hypothetical protein IKI40_04025, partial [Treponema sp.]|nr:hypothetical protein [Treponema sp.]